jgi:DNA-nicking Smr family endonuclease
VRERLRQEYLNPIALTNNKHTYPQENMEMGTKAAGPLISAIKECKVNRLYPYHVIHGHGHGHGHGRPMMGE